MSKPTSCLITFGFTRRGDGVTCFAQHLNELYVSLNYYQHTSEFYLDCQHFLFAVMRGYSITAVWQKIKGSDDSDKFSINF